jgi:hypothetical protein
VRLVDKYARVGTRGFRARTRVLGKHRTEVTERGEVGRRMRLGGHRGFCGRIRGGTEAAHAERRGEGISLANLYGFNRIRTSLCGFAHQTDPNRK